MVKQPVKKKPVKKKKKETGKWTRQQRAFIRSQICKDRGKTSLNPDEVVDAILSVNKADPLYSLRLETIYKLGIKHEASRKDGDADNQSPPAPLTRPLATYSAEPQFNGEAEETPCCICYESLVETSRANQLFLCDKCNSVTHQSCVKKWHNAQRITDNRCPMCNS